MTPAMSAQVFEIIGANEFRKNTDEKNDVNVMSIDYYQRTRLKLKSKYEFGDICNRKIAN